jgi:hypothetical protein
MMDFHFPFLRLLIQEQIILNRKLNIWFTTFVIICYNHLRID